MDVLRMDSHFYVTLEFCEMLQLSEAAGDENRATEFSRAAECCTHCIRAAWAVRFAR